MWMKNYGPIMCLTKLVYKGREEENHNIRMSGERRSKIAWNYRLGEEDRGNSVKRMLRPYTQ
jgi:hypothetical protein